jgi:hypothetical protein
LCIAFMFKQFTSAPLIYLFFSSCFIDLLLQQDLRSKIKENMATPYKPKNILITGADGFIASHVTIRIVQKYPDYKIVVLDKLDYSSNLKNLLPVSSLPNFKFVKGDIVNADLVNFLLVTENIDAIMHFAAQTRRQFILEVLWVYKEQHLWYPCPSRGLQGHWADQEVHPCEN